MTGVGSLRCLPSAGSRRPRGPARRTRGGARRARARGAGGHRRQRRHADRRHDQQGRRPHPVGARSRAAAIAPDGTRGYVAAGRRVAAIDLATRQVVAGVNAGGAVTALAVSADGQRLYAARRGAIDVIDAPTMTLKASIALGAKATGAALAISADATRAVVVPRRQAHRRRRPRALPPVAPREARRRHRRGLRRHRLQRLRRDAAARTGSRLVRVDTETGRVTRKIGLGKGLGGGVALTNDGRRAIVGAARGSAVTAIVAAARGQAAARPHRSRARAARGLPRRHARLRRRRRRRAPSRCSARCRSSA